MQTVIRKTPRVIRKPVQTETTEYQTTNVHEPITSEVRSKRCEKDFYSCKTTSSLYLVVQKSTSVVKDIRVEKQSEKIVDFSREVCHSCSPMGNSKNVLPKGNHYGEEEMEID